MLLAVVPRKAAAQDFVTTALSGLPTQTLRVESSSPSKLRKLSNYKSLRGKFLGPRLQQLESTLDQIGVHEDDIDNLVIGWKPGDKEMDLYGYASGHFDKAGIANHAAAENLTPTPISGQQAYCLTAGVAEQMCEGVDSSGIDQDTLGMFPGNKTILNQWGPEGDLQALYPGVDLLSGWWRHNRGCMTLWVNGNVSRIKYVPRNVGVDYRWYTGEVPNTMPTF